jgi:hypothetical protein
VVGDSVEAVGLAVGLVGDAVGESV